MSNFTMPPMVCAAVCKSFPHPPSMSSVPQKYKTALLRSDVATAQAIAAQYKYNPKMAIRLAEIDADVADRISPDVAYTLYFG